MRSSFGIILCVLVFSTLFIACEQKNTIDDAPVKYQPSKFKYHIFGDFTSSGGNRNFDATLYIENDEIISGEQEYVSWPNGATNETITKCSLNNELKRWVNENNGPCSITLIEIPTTLQEVETKISAEEYVLASTCTHRTICYERIDY